MMQKSCSRTMHIYQPELVLHTNYRLVKIRKVSSHDFNSSVCSAYVLLITLVVIYKNSLCICYTILYVFVFD